MRGIGGCGGRELIGGAERAGRPWPEKLGRRTSLSFKLGFLGLMGGSLRGKLGTDSEVVPSDDRSVRSVTAERGAGGHGTERDMRLRILSLLRASSSSLLGASIILSILLFTNRRDDGLLLLLLSGWWLWPRPERNGDGSRARFLSRNCWCCTCPGVVDVISDA